HRPAARLGGADGKARRSGLPRLSGGLAAGRLHHLRPGAPEHHGRPARTGGAPAARLAARPARADGAEAMSAVPASRLGLVWRLGAATTLIVTAFAMTGPVLAVLLQQRGHGTTFIGAFSMLPFLMVGLLMPSMP